ncbi:hypothetical protein ACFY3G_18275 [Streptomyces phaeochromogenes]|uniref:hypothetical protein n=1 Tax=Streptomyces phaeochromogenes TaxID=1923 RepID=UPI0036941BA7
MNLHTSLRLRLKCAEWNVKDRLDGRHKPVKRYTMTTARTKRRRHKMQRQAVMDAGHMLLLAFILGGALWVLFAPSVRALVQQVGPTSNTSLLR